MVFYDVEDDVSSPRGEIPVTKEPGSHHDGAPGMVRALPQRVGLVQPDIMQERREAQDLCVVLEPLCFRKLLGQSVNPETMGVAPDWVRPCPGYERLHLFDYPPHPWDSSGDCPSTRIARRFGRQ